MKYKVLVVIIGKVPIVYENKERGGQEARLGL